MLQAFFRQLAWQKRFDTGLRYFEGWGRDEGSKLTVKKEGIAKHRDVSRLPVFHRVESSPVSREKRTVGELQPKNLHLSLISSLFCELAL